MGIEGYKLEAMAEFILFEREKTPEMMNELLARYELQFRKNKGIPDINKAVKKALKHGLGKVEHEQEFLEIYLNDILKAV